MFLKARLCRMRRALMLLMAVLLLGCVGGDVKTSEKKTPTPESVTQSPSPSPDEGYTEGEELFEAKCSCHYSYYENPSGRPGWLDVWEKDYYGQPAEKWGEGIDIMVEKRFTSVTEQERLAIAKYLAERFSK